ncbi:fructose-1,6-bisphosphatase class 1 [Aliidongia dinghuensis]|uniref:Fructose-1,6-bisphosphatase class 1 n=1 Tax=Aliidongia dinghuensis TaxID=1867774 RepID=A0A8J2YNG3_9PROT|nr:class 1 fructose-bisphosphatase [Aliidongia dinghuensis]GGE98899.1 fructose-1,6-bisphosphatase class 1 [Aliidongia dinghuensis]
MSVRCTSLGQFIKEAQNQGCIDEELAALIESVAHACTSIATVVAQGTLATTDGVATEINVQGEAQKPIDVLTNAIMLETCERSGALRGMVSEEMAEPYSLPPGSPRGRHLLVFDPLDGSSNVELNMPFGTIFSVLRAPEDAGELLPAHFLQRGRQQLAAGFALYGAATMLVLTLGAGVHGFTLDRTTGTFLLTHPDLRIAETTCEFAVNASNERFWEPPVRRYVEECIEGRAGPRRIDFNMRWIAAMVAEVHRILLRGGLFMYPRDRKVPARPGRLRLLYEASPMAMLVEQAGGAASTGREPILDIVPEVIHQRVPVILGSREEVERLVRYHEIFDRGEALVFRTPLFNTRTLFQADANEAEGLPCR